MFEKYHAVNVGYPGGGGEYIVQEGFGWTNGVTQWILNKFSGNLTAPAQCLKIDREISMKREEVGIHDISEAVANTAYSKRIPTIVFCVLLKIGLLARFQ